MVDVHHRGYAGAGVLLRQLALTAFHIYPTLTFSARQARAATSKQ